MNVCSSTLLGCNNVNFSKVLQFTLKLMRRRKTSFNCSDLGNYRWCFSSVRFCSLLGLSLHWFMRKWEFCSFCLSSGSPASDWGCRVGKEWAWRPWGAAAGEGALQKLQSVLCPHSSPPLSVSLRVFFLMCSHVKIQHLLWATEKKLLLRAYEKVCILGIWR